MLRAGADQAHEPVDDGSAPEGVVLNTGRLEEIHFVDGFDPAVETVKGAVGQPTPGADAPQDEPEQPQADQGRDKDDDGHRDPGIQVGPGVNGGQEEERPDAMAIVINRRVRAKAWG
ncbi:hypothetical protein [Brevundimonas abyssalis]|uniref:hypothetical protein n=1 Tax=Brevundimonas abyssalis TaxID=1125965 RepID=UPI0005EC78E1|nr:hypothetical protein [Brevundimonas abyssalis]